MDQVIKTLTDSGLTQKEALVYTTLLSCGTVSAYTVSEKSGIKPPTTYLTLQNLATKGLVYSVPRAKKKLFAAKQPSELVSDIEKVAQQARKILPELTALIPSSSSPKINVKYFHGVNGIKEALEYGYRHNIPTKEVVGFYASAENVPKLYIDLSEKYMRSLKKKGIKVRGITPDHKSLDAILRIDEILGHSIIKVPYPEYSAKVSIEAEDRLVRIILNHEYRAIIIDNIELAQMIKQIFEMVWKENRVR